jgi:Ca2+-binding RTX toxin-like protein
MQFLESVVLPESGGENGRVTSARPSDSGLWAEGRGLVEAFDFSAVGRGHAETDLAGAADDAGLASTGLQAAANRAPKLITPAADVKINEDAAVAFALPTGMFRDPDGDRLSYSAVLADGSALPSWLVFDARRLTFAGTPPRDWNGSLAVAVTASDGKLSATDTFKLTLKPVNDAPVVQHAMPALYARPGEAWSFQLPAGLVTDVDSPLKYAVVGLPDWLTFDPISRTLYGTAPAGTLGTTIPLTLRVKDEGVTKSLAFSIAVQDQPTPTLTKAIADVTIAEDTRSWSMTLDPATFSAGALLTAKLADGSPLPDWIEFDPFTGTFSGKPPKNWDQKLDIQVTGGDGGRSASDVFSLKFTPNNDAPILVVPTADQQFIEDRAFAYQLPAGTFVEADGQSLTYAAALANGKALPKWLHFDAATQTFSGTPPKDFAGSVDVTVVASDGSLKTRDTFSLDFKAVNDAPDLVKHMADQVVPVGKAWSAALPRGMFTDVDSASLTYAAALANGDPLPSWLRFDAATQTFSGVAPKSWNGSTDVRITATDGDLSTSETFHLGDGRPILTADLQDQGVHAGTAWSYRLAKGSFVDGNGEGLAYSAKLADGSALPGWLKFDAATQTFSGTPPKSFKGSLDVLVTASDGKLKASDVFRINQGAEFQQTGDGLAWGSDLHFRFDDLYYEYTGRQSFSFDIGDSWGPTGVDIEAGISGELGVDYGLKAGFLFDVALNSSTFDFDYEFDIVETGSDVNTVFNGSPYFTTAGVTKGEDFTSEGGTHHLKAFLGVDAWVDYFGSIYAYAGVDTPVGDAEIDGGTDFHRSIIEDVVKLAQLYFGMPPDFELPKLAVEVDLSSGDEIAKFESTFAGLIDGSITFAVPEPIDISGAAFGAATANGLKPLEASGLSDPFVSAGVDLWGTFLNVVLTALGVPPDAAEKIKPWLTAGDVDLFGSAPGFDMLPNFFGADLNIFNWLGIDAGVRYKTIEADMSLSARLQENYSYIPDVAVSMRSEFGQVVTGKLGDKLNFKVTKEGEGTFAVAATYDVSGHMTSTLSVAISLDFHYLVGMLEAYAGISFDLFGHDVGFEAGTGELVGPHGDLIFPFLTIPVYTHTEDLHFGQQVQNLDLAYENFRTVKGSGDSFTLTTHQTDALGNDRKNVFVGNGLDNRMIGYGGDDRFTGGAGDDNLDGGAGNDTLDGGDGNNTLSAGQGDNLIVEGDGDNRIIAGSGTNVFRIGTGNNRFDLGDGGDVLTVGDGDDTINAWHGDDRLTVGHGANVVVGSLGDDTITAGKGDDTLVGGGGDDLIYAGAGTNLVYGSGGDDVIIVGGESLVYGDAPAFDPFNQPEDYGSGRDAYGVTPGFVEADLIDIEAGEFIDLSAYKSIRSFADLDADAFNIGRLKLPDGGVILFHGELSDYGFIFYGQAADLDLQGTAGNDVMLGYRGADTLNGLKGHDKLDGYRGADVLDGGDGNDTLVGGGGKDLLQGGSGRDVIYVDDEDRAYGGADMDNFVMILTPHAKTTAVIKDFQAASDGGDAFQVDNIDLTQVDGSLLNPGRQTVMWYDFDQKSDGVHVYIYTDGDLDHPTYEFIVEGQHPGLSFVDFEV